MSKPIARKGHSKSQAHTPHVMVSVLSMRERTGWIHPNLVAEIVRMALAAGTRYRMTYVPMNNVSPVSAARNRIVTRHFLPSAAEWLCMFDNDVVPPENVIEVILTAPAEADIVILPYWVWNSDGHPMLCFGDLRTVNGIPQMDVHGFSRPGWHEGGAGGTGAIFMRRGVFERIKKPYFKFFYDKDEEQTLGEDIYFTAKARESGCRIFTNLNYRCSHHRTLDLAEVNVGVNSILQRYVKTAQELFAAHGIELPDLNGMLEMQTKLHDIGTRRGGPVRAARRRATPSRSAR